MFLLLLAFIDLKSRKFYYHSLLVLLANITLALIIYWLVTKFDEQLAFLGFITAITPTAIAAPAMIELLGGNVAYVTVTVVVTNLAIALLMPLLVAWLIPTQIDVSTREILISILYVLGIPLILAEISKKTVWSSSLRQLKFCRFYIWNLMLILATAKASHYILWEYQGDKRIIGAIAIFSFLICCLNFSVGKFLGGREFSREASQALGQKNTMFTVWLSLEFFDPTIALGPMFYIIYHNLYNTYLLIRLPSDK